MYDLIKLKSGYVAFGILIKELLGTWYSGVQMVTKCIKQEPCTTENAWSLILLNKAHGYLILMTSL